LQKDITTDLKQVLISKFFYFCFKLIWFSEPHPFFAKAFEVHVDDLNKAAYEYLRLTNGFDSLCLRKTSSKMLDTKLFEAKQKLSEYLVQICENSENILIEDLLK
jgi:hypothetical protein